MSPLLFDQNLSPRVVGRLADVYPNSVHVSTVGLSTAFDFEIWEYAREKDHIIVTKDADFSELGLLRGFPAKVVWIRRGQLLHGRDRSATTGKLQRHSGDQ